jgi:hypothetical protein
MKTRYLIISLVVFLIAGCSRPYSAKPLSALKIFEDRQQSALWMRNMTKTRWVLLKSFMINPIHHKTRA